MEIVVEWVGKNKSKINSCINKYISYSPYEYEEFMQAAYEAALRAFYDKEHEFEQSFWFHFRKYCLEMTYTKGCKALPCFHVEFGENLPAIQSTPPVINDATSCLSHRQEDVVVSMALSLMTKKEKEVWELLLLGFSLKKIAAVLGKSKTAVIKLREKGKRRLLCKK